MKSIKGRKSQTWYIDFIFAILLFSFILYLFYSYSLNWFSDDDSLQLDARILSDVLISSGSPDNWTSDNVNQVGLTDDLYLSRNKLLNMSSMDYNYVRSMIPISSDFLFYFTLNDSQINVGGFEYYGHPDANITNIVDVFDPMEMVTLNRLVIFQGRIIEMRFIVWEE